MNPNAPGPGGYGIWKYTPETGNDWTPLKGALRCLAVNPINAQELTGVNQACEIWRSEDGGQTWRQLTGFGVYCSYGPDGALYVIGINPA